MSANIAEHSGTIAIHKYNFSLNPLKANTSGNTKLKTPCIADRYNKAKIYFGTIAFFKLKCFLIQMGGIA